MIKTSNYKNNNVYVVTNCIEHKTELDNLIFDKENIAIYSSYYDKGNTKSDIMIITSDNLSNRDYYNIIKKECKHALVVNTMLEMGYTTL